MGRVQRGFRQGDDFFARAVKLIVCDGEPRRVVPRLRHRNAVQAIFRRNAGENPFLDAPILRHAAGITVQVIGFDIQDDCRFGAETRRVFQLKRAHFNHRYRRPSGSFFRQAVGRRQFRKRYADIARVARRNAQFPEQVGGQLHRRSLAVGARDRHDPPGEMIRAELEFACHRNSAGDGLPQQPGILTDAGTGHHQIDPVEPGGEVRVAEFRIACRHRLHAQRTGELQCRLAADATPDHQYPAHCYAPIADSTNFRR
ncbi:hypothetical protein SDC9_132215 [bioreactor metagenome]|uniref:Uncharacterized protein n=1 Tax=bioreactor metagenome TaxID=1076179 RepID=A0A645D7V1_9ZZZZ